MEVQCPALSDFMMKVTLQENAEIKLTPCPRKLTIFDKHSEQLLEGDDLAKYWLWSQICHLV